MTIHMIAMTKATAEETVCQRQLLRMKLCVGDVKRVKEQNMPVFEVFEKRTRGSNKIKSKQQMNFPPQEMDLDPK